MIILNCRICNGALFPDPILRFDNQPAHAQKLPDAATLHEDASIDLLVMQCSGCGVVQLKNDPVPYYREVIRAAGVSAEMSAFRRRQFAEWVEENGLRDKPVVELGCGGGEYLRLLAESGVQSFGLEYGRNLVERCRAQHLSVQQGYLGDDDCRLERTFSGFLILNWLEHLPDLTRVLNKLNGSLSQNAVGLIEVPNFDMILRNNAFSEFVADHLYYFTRQTLTTTLEMHGLEVLSCREIWYDYVLSAHVVKREPLVLPGFLTAREGLIAAIDGFLMPFAREDVAIWGASHQALTIIAMTNLQERVKFVVDSADFKQNRFTPASHLPIVSPETLATSSIKAVIIMASSYSNEVATIIRERFDPAISLAILRESTLEIL